MIGHDFDSVRVGTRLLLILGVVFTAAFVACGDNGDDDNVGAGDRDTTTQASGDGGDVVSAVAQDIKWKEEELAAEAGSVDIEFVNEGQIAHTFVIEGREKDLKLKVNRKGDTDSGTIDLESGEYVFYCDVPGHRAAGMEGTLTVS